MMFYIIISISDNEVIINGGLFIFIFIHVYFLYTVLYIYFNLLDFIPDEESL